MALNRTPAVCIRYEFVWMKVCKEKPKRSVKAKSCRMMATMMNLSSTNQRYRYDDCLLLDRNSTVIWNSFRWPVPSVRRLTDDISPWKSGFGPQQLHIVFNNNNNNNNNIYLLELGCHPVAVVLLHVNKTWNWLLINLSLEGYMRSM